MTFVEALNSQNLETIRSFPKADLHNHFVLGGSREYIFHKTGVKGSCWRMGHGKGYSYFS